MFHLTCPHCQHRYHLVGPETQAWYDDHVTHCPRRPFSAAWLQRLRRAWSALRQGTAPARERLALHGRLFLQLHREGELLDARVLSNLVVNAGRAHVIDVLQGGAGTPYDYEGIGTGATAPAAGDTGLQTPAANGIGTLTQPDAYTDRNTITFAAGSGTGAITEAGRFIHSGATLIARQTFSVINKGAADSLTITHDLTV